MSVQKPDEKRGRIAFIFFILLGYVLGFFLKRVQLGLIIGLAIGLLSASIVRKR
jgi:hypothetical protein